MCAALVRTTPLPACASELGGKGKGYTHIQSGPAHVDTQTTGARTTNEVGTRISVSGKRTTRTPYQGRSRGPYQARKGPRSNSPPNIATGHTHPRYTGSPAAEGMMEDTSLQGKGWPWKPQMGTLHARSVREHGTATYNGDVLHALLAGTGSSLQQGGA